LSDLDAIASSSTTNYSVRVQAATELHGHGGPQDLQSAELTLLASGKTILPEQADKPYFQPARLAAAMSAPAVQRPTILRKAIAVMPGDALRLRIFRAEFALSHNELALAAVQPLLQSPGGYVQEMDTGTNDESAIDSPVEASDAIIPGDAAEQTDDSTEPGERALIPSLLRSTEAKVEFALAVATLYQENYEYQQALAYARLASRLNPEENRRAKIDKRIAVLARLLRVKNENNARRPAIGEALEQAVIVRPRIVDTTVQQVQP
jgi:hypothetical protein